jgi:MtN3 and saliva related transmembrane protein
MSATHVVGYLAAALGVSAFMPQVWRVIKTRDTTSLSTAMWVFNSVAFAMWISYGVMLGEWPIILPNVLCLLMSVFILIMNLVGSRTRNRIANALDPSGDSSSAKPVTES